MVRILDWNVCSMNGAENKIDYLKRSLDNGSFIAILQEVKPTLASLLQDEFGGRGIFLYSLDFRPPGKYDSGARELGVAIIASDDIEVRGSGVLPRSLMPDRTLWADLRVKGQDMRVFGLHSITGCDHVMAKSYQFLSYAEAVDEMRPDIVGIDANEPKIDGYSAEEMTFFKQRSRDNGAPTFFRTMEECGLRDSLIRNVDTSRPIEGRCITCSHVIRSSKDKVRYDFVYLNGSRFIDYSCRYDYDGAVEAGSDHAAITVDMKLC